MRRYSPSLWSFVMSVLLTLSLCATAPLSAVADDDDDDDEDDVGTLIVTLQDDGASVVPGACFQLVDATGAVVAESCDTKARGDRRPNNGRTGFFQVPTGTYMLRLVTLPTEILPVDVREVVIQGDTETNETVTLVLQEDADDGTQDPSEPVDPTDPTAPQPSEPDAGGVPAVGDLIVTLVDDQGTPIGRACFEIFDVAGQSIASCDTEEFDSYPDNGNTGFIQVPAGVYTLRLVAAPAGVGPTDDREVTVVEGGETTEIVGVSIEEESVEPEESTELSEPSEPTEPGPAVGEVDDDNNNTLDQPAADQAIVRLIDGIDPVAFADSYQFTVLRSMPGRNIHLLGLNPSVADADEIADLDKDDGTVWAEYNYSSQAPEGRPRRYFSSGGYSAPQAADAPPPAVLNIDAASCVTGAGVIVAVLDTGIDAGHSALGGQVLGGYNAVDDSTNTADSGDGIDNDGDGIVDEMTGHGTHVAGIIHKVAPGAALLPVTVLDSDGVGDAFYVARGIYFAVEQGSVVINLSLSSTADARVVNEATAWAADQGVMVVAAAGNDNRKQPEEYPATYAGAYSVAASDPNDAKADFSNYNVAVDLSAPGTDIVSAFPGATYVSWSGTSMATPFVAGTSALLWERLGGPGTSQIRDALAAGADPIVYTESNWNEHLGAGRLNVGQSVNCGG